MVFAEQEWGLNLGKIVCYVELLGVETVDAGSASGDHDKVIVDYVRIFVDRA